MYSYEEINDCTNCNCDDCVDCTPGTITGGSTNGAVNGDAWVDLSDGRFVKHPNCSITYIEDTDKPLRLYSEEESERYMLQEENGYLATITPDGTISFDETGVTTLSVIDRETGEKVAEYQITVIIEADGTLNYAVATYCNKDDEADTPVPVEPTSIALEIDPDRTTMIIGSECTIAATVSPTGANQAVIFSSSNTAVATVTEDGWVNLVGLGNVDITVQSAVKESVTAMVSLTVADCPDYGEVASVEDGLYSIKQQQSLLKRTVSSEEEANVPNVTCIENAEIDEDAKWWIRSKENHAYIYYINQSNSGEQEYYLYYDDNQLLVEEFNGASMDLYKWKFLCHNDTYSLYHVNTETYLCVMNGNLVMLPIEDAVESDFRWEFALTVELNMPVCLNQYYEKINDDFVDDSGCCLCSIGNVLSYYDKEKVSGYSANELVEQGWWIHKSGTDKNGNIIYWGQVSWQTQDIVNFGAYTEVDENLKADNYSLLRDIIRTQIAMERPVMLHCKGKNSKGKDFQHWTVVYKFTLNAQDLDNIYVLDSSNNQNPLDPEGFRHSLSQSMEYNCNQNIVAYKLTEPKH